MIINATKDPNVQPVSRGGTGKTTHTSNSVLTGNGTSNVGNVASANGALYATSNNGAPKFGTLPVAQGGTGATTAANARSNLGVNAENLGVNDYVVEQGTSGIWTYQKWNSGKAECWGTYTASGKKMNEAWGSLYVAGVMSGRISYPFTFTERPKEIVQQHTSAIGCFLYSESEGLGLNTASETAKYSVARPGSSSTSVTVYLDFYVVGKWK